MRGAARRGTEGAGRSACGQDVLAGPGRRAGGPPQAADGPRRRRGGSFAAADYRSQSRAGRRAWRPFVYPLTFFVYPLSLWQAHLEAGNDASVAARVAGDQRASFYGPTSAGAAAAGGLDEDTVQLAVDIICDNQW